MGSGDDRAFRVSFSGEGLAKLRGQVQEKLKEFMGDYTDDTLVEYVIVLLKNGRNKEEAKNELDVFLGDDSDSFVCWLWDHLSLNLNLYMQQQEAPLDGVLKTRPSSVEHAVKNEIHHVKSESDQVKSDRPRSRHKREWKGLLRDADEHPTLQGVVVDTTHSQVESQHKLARTTQPISPKPEAHRKRSRPEDGPKKKRESISQATIAAPRRLLQFAVRDAVATSRPSAEPSLKRLRSVVSTSMEESTEERPHRLRSVARLPNAMATAIKAVAEAAKDVKKIRSSANVFDRLGSATETLDTKGQLELREDISEDVEDEKFVDVTEVPLTYHQRSDYSGRYASKLQSDTVMASDPALEDGDYGDINVVDRSAMDAFQKHSYVGNNSVNPPLVEHSVGNRSDGIMLKSAKDQDQPTSTPYASRKIMTGPLNVNTWKSPQYQEARKAVELGYNKSTQSSEAMGAKSAMQLMKENSTPMAVDNGNVKSSSDTKVESQKIPSAVPGESGCLACLYSTGTPTEDSDSRTIFVNNVHFAATKDSLSRHFNKFGEVLKVVILTDAATGQPKGSAYVEFMRKESAEHALSLDGTSFMSRILKVVRKGSAPPEATTPTISWPRIARGVSFGASRFGRSPFPRGMPNAYRARGLTIKPGARSLQWKRDAQSSPSQASASTNAVPTSSTPRSMTYVRSEQKTTNGTSNAA
nr:polyadenylate-binding protein 2 [Ipomoea batatas]